MVECSVNIKYFSLCLKISNKLICKEHLRSASNLLLKMIFSVKNDFSLALGPIPFSKNSTCIWDCKLNTLIGVVQIEKI